MSKTRLAPGVTALIAAFVAMLGVLFGVSPAQAATYQTTTGPLGGTSVNVRTAPSTSAGVAYTLPNGASINIVCQTIGGKLGFSAYAENRTWDRLADGRYIHDVVTTTPGSGTRQFLPDGGYVYWTSSIPRCDTAPSSGNYKTTTAPLGGGSSVNVRTSPSRAASVAYTLPNGASINIVCQTIGGKLGFSAYAENRTWDRLADGRYIHDVVTTTPGSGTRQFLPDGGYVYWTSSIPRCDTSGTSSTRETRAVAWGLAREGDIHSGGLTDNDLWSGWCERFVELTFNTRGQYASAIANYRAQLNAGRIHSDANAPAGAMVFYNWTSYGHVALSLGNGTAISTKGAYGDAKAIARITINQSGYLGWAYAPAAWPGR